jgi:hypothetical protein
MGAKLHWSKGKQPRSQVKVPKSMLSALKEVNFLDNEEVGLEAAIL